MKRYLSDVLPSPFSILPLLLIYIPPSPEALIVSRFSQMQGVIEAGISLCKRLGLSGEALRADIRPNGFTTPHPPQPNASSVPGSDVKQLKPANGES